MRRSLLSFGFRGISSLCTSQPQTYTLSPSLCSSFLFSSSCSKTPLLSSSPFTSFPSVSFTSSSFTPELPLFPNNPTSPLAKRWMLHNIPTEELEKKLQDYLKEKKFGQVILLWEELQKRIPELQLKTIRGMGSTLILLHKPRDGLHFLQQAVQISSQQLAEVRERHEREKEVIGESDRHSKEREREREREEGKAKREWFLSRLALGNGMRDAGEQGAGKQYEDLLEENLTTFLRARTLYDQGMFQMETKKDLNQAKHSFQATAKLLEEDNFSKKKEFLLSDAYLQLGICYGGTSRKALDSWKQGLQVAQRCGNTPTIHECLAHLILGYGESGDREMTVRLQYMYAELMRTERRWEEVRGTTLEIGESLLAIGRPLEAIEEFQKAMKLSQNSSSIGECRYQIGLAYLYQNEQSDKAELLFNTALLCLYPNVQNDLSSTAAAEMTITNQGLVVDKRPLSLPENASDPNILSCLVSMALSLSYQGKQSHALQYAELAAQVQLHLWDGDAHAARLTNGAVGVIYGELNRFQQALQLFSSVYSSAVRERDEENILFALGWLGKIHQFHDLHDSAKGYFTKQLKMAVDLNNPWMKAQAMKSMAWSDARNKNFEQALSVLEQHVPLAIKLAQKESAIGSIRLAKFMYDSLGNKARSAQLEHLANELESQLSGNTTK